MPETMLRIGTRSDMGDIMRIEKACFPEIHEKEELFLERMEVFGDGFYVLQHRDQVVGYISSEIWNYKDPLDANSFSLGHSIREAHQPEGKELYLSSMGILPGHQGKGFGKTLFKDGVIEILKNFSHIESVLLIVSEKWGNARKIYSDCGFSEILTIKNFFQYGNDSPEDGIVMRKKLP